MENEFFTKQKNVFKNQTFVILKIFKTMWILYYFEKKLIKYNTMIKQAVLFESINKSYNNYTTCGGDKTT